MTEDENKVLASEHLESHKAGGSVVVPIPAHWRRTFRKLQGAKLFFEARLEMTPNGQLLFVCEVVKE